MTFAANVRSSTTSLGNTLPVPANFSRFDMTSMQECVQHLADTLGNRFERVETGVKDHQVKLDKIQTRLQYVEVEVLYIKNKLPEFTSSIVDYREELDLLHSRTKELVAANKLMLQSVKMKVEKLNVTSTAISSKVTELEKSIALINKRNEEEESLRSKLLKSAHNIQVHLNDRIDALEHGHLTHLDDQLQLEATLSKINEQLVRHVNIGFEETPHESASHNGKYCLIFYHCLFRRLILISE